MSWERIEEEIKLNSEVKYVEQIIQSQEKILDYLKGKKYEIEKRLRHIEYRRSIDERSKKVKVETRGEIDAIN